MELFLQAVLSAVVARRYVLLHWLLQADGCRRHEAERRKRTFSVKQQIRHMNQLSAARLFTSYVATKLRHKARNPKQTKLALQP